MSRGHIVEPRRQVPRLAVLLFGVAGLAAVITLVSLLAPQVVDQFTASRVVTENSAWISRAWTQTDRTNDEIATITAILTDNGIDTVYIQTHAWHGQTGEFVELPFSQNFVERFRRNASTIKVYIWVSLDVERLYDPDSLAQVIAAARQAVIQRSFDGVLLQVRSVPDDSQEFVTLLRDLRAAIGPQGILAISVPPDRKPADPDVPSNPVAADELTWSLEYKRRVALNVNEMVLMAHASGLEDVDDYENWLAYQVAAYAEVIDSLDIEMTYLVALPTYGAEIGHDPDVENVESAIRGILMGMARARVGQNQVDGVSLYPWEQTDTAELETYWRDWVSRKE